MRQDGRRWTGDPLSFHDFWSNRAQNKSNGDAKYFTNRVLYQFFRFRSFFFRLFSFRFFQFFVKFQISIGHGWGGRHGRTERHGRAPAVANWNLKFFKLGLESSKTAGTRLKTIRNDPKTVRNRPKPSENGPKPSEMVMVILLRGRLEANRSLVANISVRQHLGDVIT